MKLLQTIITENAPKPAGHYSHAAIYNGLVYVSGQLPVNPISGINPENSLEEQADQALKNLEAVLVSAGSDRYHVLKTTVYVNGIEFWDRVNQVYADFFGEHKPARTVVPTSELHHGFKVEIDAIAAIKPTAG